MHLTPREIDKLVLHGAGSLAQKRLARGLRLGYPEAVALIATVLLELIRDGQSVAALMDLGRRILGRKSRGCIGHRCGGCSTRGRYVRGLQHRHLARGQRRRRIGRAGGQAHRHDGENGAEGAMAVVHLYGVVP